VTVGCQKLHTLQQNRGPQHDQADQKSLSRIDQAKQQANDRIGTEVLNTSIKEMRTLGKRAKRYGRHESQASPWEHEKTPFNHLIGSPGAEIAI
jgi:predicted GTPase